MPEAKRHPSGVTDDVLAEAREAYDLINKTRGRVAPNIERAAMLLMQAAIDEADSHGYYGCGVGADVDCPICEAVKDLAYQYMR